ncbi:MULTISPECIES: bifunctional phosphopantothenoylcysteine decarboxylase/phosphopantothenate--cysteine ligase CoaBC [unclassified Arenibacter]|uniref:bifunctional phosphopantothenoylcysteine decarboxylase/phosphopantothenate--cysteine ligase CoaBC n=1 Tax=unclassified Arenibacter TaxID=2615047 RepID=UPI000E34C973|nr:MULTISPECIES: bifunctional phosphopantothenoylcysteine decarboxylase/phosphopantothenate--cysteine ligase CoaBC [unclassified Arenibacter]MCM4163507.1 bifunctional phosphopantothenoylcysteine decarboxylase/phosphopantothenate--cysteine ligase CoaBC [Arenibacter sp. A80]RFT57499.1 bifunctional phosphopantothenoylcysteine decarboxylase/phosphopantothenate--cysteine ligase CoaBC [Arenibacter sp. P308M17]
MLGGKNILLGITGGIAAYKTTFLVRLLIKAGANVKVVLTESASSFVTPLTLATLSKNAVLSSFVDEESGTVSWNNHVALGLWADIMLIAPATANTLSKMANGTCDNLLMATYLSAKCPVYFAPAMDLDMYKHPSTTATFKKLLSFGNIMIPAASGELASGLIGEGRMAEPEDIVSFLNDHLGKGLPLEGKIVLITAGPTYEAIDPVRFIGNHSSGLMGYELAQNAAKLGAKVYLVSGPSHLSIQHSLIKLVKVTSADEMYRETVALYPEVDIAICAAAVADYKPKLVAEQKIKKTSDEFTITLVRNKDILFSLGEMKNNQFLVGFALETENEVENAIGKLKRKNLDAIVLNSMNDSGAGFGKLTNKISFIDKNLDIKTFGLKTKAEVALDILNEIKNRIHA